MFRSVIAGFDASDQSRDALALAQALTDPDGELVVCCVFPPDPPLVEPIDAPLSAESEAVRRLEEAERQLGADARASYLARRGFSAAEGLQAAAEARGCDLIVVGSSHRGAFGRILPGSVTRQVLQAAPCAVAVAPQGLHTTPWEAPRTIGVAYDGSDQAGVALHAAAAMARSSGATVEVIDVVDIVSEFGGWAAAWSYGEVLEAERAAARAQVDDARLALSDVDSVGSVREGGAADQLVGASDHLDLLVIGSRNYGPLRRALLGTVSGRVAEHARCPVVVVPRGAVDNAATAFTEVEAEVRP
jgi:nucleotide-binding universal stress UspA family protein